MFRSLEVHSVVDGEKLGLKFAFARVAAGIVKTDWEKLDKLPAVAIVTELAIDRLPNPRIEYSNREFTSVDVIVAAFEPVV
jgi:hypothetical protein